MKEKVIKKDKLKTLLDMVKKKYKLFAPLKKEGNIIFDEIIAKDGFDLDYFNSSSSPKSLFFPHTDTLFRFSGGSILEEKVSDKPRLIFGMRPCDAKGLSLLDKIFIDKEIQDSYYLKRRNNTTIIALACNEPQSTCFCTALDGGPANEEGSDVILFDLGSELLAKSGTKKGEEFLNEFKSAFSEAKKSNSEKRDKLVKENQNKLKSKVSVKGLKETLDNAFDSSFWDMIHKKCLGCGICTYLCPTCHCFDVTDEVSTGGGKRVRTWDSCLFPLFTLHASGHNPRPTYKERFRQRIMHKFNYCPENYKRIFCVGCGRCIRDCPVNLDLREVLISLGSLG